MSRILLDTSAYSALREGHAEIERVVAEAEEVYLSSVVLGELHAGFRGGSRRRINEAQLQAFMDLPDVKVAVVTEETAGTPRSSTFFVHPACQSRPTTLGSRLAPWNTGCASFRPTPTSSAFPKSA